MILLLSKVAFKLSIVLCWGGRWAWVRLGKIKCAAKALARVSACSSFNFAKGWQIVFHFSFHLLSVVSVFTLTA